MLLPHHRSVARPLTSPTQASSALTSVRRSEAESEILVLDGEIDLGSASALEDALRDAARTKARRLVLDLAELDFRDSTAIDLLVAAHQRAEASGQKLILVHVPAHAQRLFALTGITPGLTIE